MCLSFVVCVYRLSGVVVLIILICDQFFSGYFKLLHNCLLINGAGRGLHACTGIKNENIRPLETCWVSVFLMVALNTLRCHGKFKLNLISEYIYFS